MGTCIAMDTMGCNTHVSYHAGGGGVGGELAILGSEDGSATLWRFISSHYLPLRPRLRLKGHGGSAILSVAISSSLNICASVSEKRCCLFHLGNGQLLRSFSPIDGCVFGNITCLSESGYIIFLYSSGIVAMFTLEGICIGSKIFQGTPKRIVNVQKNVIAICTTNGTKFCLLSSLNPLCEIDEWNFTNKEAYDIDIGPCPKQVLAAMASSSGSLLLHALPGITAFSEENRKIAVSTAVGYALAKPAQKIRSAVGNVVNRGTRFVTRVEENTRVPNNNTGGIGGFFRDAFRKQPGNNS